MWLEQSFEIQKMNVMIIEKAFSSYLVSTLGFIRP